jgi:hypothetical protein
VPAKGRRPKRRVGRPMQVVMTTGAFHLSPFPPISYPVLGSGGRGGRSHNTCNTLPNPRQMGDLSEMPPPQSQPPKIIQPSDSKPLPIQRDPKPLVPPGSTNQPLNGSTDQRINRSTDPNEPNQANVFNAPRQKTNPTDSRFVPTGRPLCLPPVTRSNNRQIRINRSTDQPINRSSAR